MPLLSEGVDFLPKENRVDETGSLLLIVVETLPSPIPAHRDPAIDSWLHPGVAVRISGTPGALPPFVGSGHSDYADDTLFERVE